MAQCFKIYGEILSGPLALLASNLDNWCCIPSIEKEISDIPGVIKLLVGSMIGILDK